MLTALHDELSVMRTGVGGCAPIAAEMAGAVWRAALSALQLLVLHQVSVCFVVFVCVLSVFWVGVNQTIAAEMRGVLHCLHCSCWCYIRCVPLSLYALLISVLCCTVCSLIGKCCAAV